MREGRVVDAKQMVPPQAPLPSPSSSCPVLVSANNRPSLEAHASGLPAGACTNTITFSHPDAMVLRVLDDLLKRLLMTGALNPLLLHAAD